MTAIVVTCGLLEGSTYCGPAIYRALMTAEGIVWTFVAWLT